MDNDQIRLEDILKRIAPWFGICMAIISMYFSYDGLDQTVTGGNPTYTEIAKYIGIVMAISVTLIQFIFNSDFNRLNSTLKVVGLVSYVYSLYTNYLGLDHLFGFHGAAGIAISIFMDVTPEAIIAWALEEETQGDMLGNIGKWVTGGGRRRFGRNKQQTSNRYASTSDDVHRDTQPFHPQGKKGQGRAALEAQYHNKSNQGKKDSKRFDIFEE